MAYIEGRLVHDADAHIMETSQWLYDYADPAIRELIAPATDANEMMVTPRRLVYRSLKVDINSKTCTNYFPISVTQW